jgi:hypothetical protein
MKPAIPLCIGLSFQLVVAGCERVPGATSDIRGFEKSDCVLSVRQVGGQGRLIDPPLIRPEHVACIQRRDEYGPTLYVMLTPEGEQRMWRFTRRNVGQSMAVFCGSNEVSRASIRQPFGKDFLVSLPSP